MDDPFPFTPVPVKPRHDGWSPPRQRMFVAALSELGLVSAAAAAVGLNTKSAYALRKRADGASFAEAWDQALDHGRGHTLRTAIQRVLEGTTTPVFYRGRQVGERQTFNDRLLLAALRAAARDPDMRRALAPPETPDGSPPDLHGSSTSRTNVP